jgi:hypothetical protein
MELPGAQRYEMPVATFLIPLNLTAIITSAEEHAL